MLRDNHDQIIVLIYLRDPLALEGMVRVFCPQLAGFGDYQFKVDLILSPLLER